MDGTFSAELLKLGLAGLVIWVITLPLIKYLIESNKAKDKRINDLVDSHLAKSNENHIKTISALNHVERSLGQVEKALTNVPQTIMEQAKKVYPPDQRPLVNVNTQAPVTASPRT